MTEDPKLENGQNEVFSRLLAVAKQLEWAGLARDGRTSCPACGAPGPNAPHAVTCELKSATDAATSVDHWPWCRCDACECPSQVDPSLTGVLCGDCAHDRHHDEIASRGA
ncbi:MAG: hypothetical protein QF554_03025 [Dehalococcoidia bacterium]|nr:hypothetical protein [Dehalococcoidia bacterium]